MTFEDELKELLANINESLDYMKVLAEQRGVSPFTLLNTDGSFAMERLLLAKAQTINAMVMLQRNRPTTTIHTNIWE